MEGDYHRYGAEISVDEEVKNEYRDKALKAYTAAEKAAQELDRTNPIRLGVALNFSVFYHEICGKRDDAIKKAKQAFEDAINEIDKLSQEAYKDSTQILQLLKDNLILWNEDGEPDGDVQVEEFEDPM